VGVEVELNALFFALPHGGGGGTGVLAMGLCVLVIVGGQGQGRGEVLSAGPSTGPVGDRCAACCM